MTDNSKPAEDGFEYQSTFYRWNLTDGSKDLIIIDRFTGMPVNEFFELVEDNFDRGRAPILLAMIATSIRNGHPDWTVERVIRMVMNLNLSEVTFIDADVEEDPLPPASEGETPSTPTGSESSAGASRSPSSETEPATYETFSATPV